MGVIAAVTERSQNRNVRKPAVAGIFYPADAPALRREVGRCLAGVRGTGPPPKALIVPHAGLVYSGPVAAEAFGLLRSGGAAIRRVILIGPSHRVAFRGIAVPSAQAFASPIGMLAIDTAARQAVLAHPAVTISDRAHEFEHSLEVQLPFLQAVLPDVTILPLVVGDATGEEVASVMELVWGGPETLILVSTDLSHFLDYAGARVADADTCRRILALEPGLSGEEACGCVGLNGFLRLARSHGLAPRQLDMRNSGDTAGDRSRVVGYAAFAFYEPRSRDP